MKKLLSLVAIVLALAAGACSSDNNSTGSTGGGTANFRVNLTDAPMMGMQSVNVTLTMVRVHQSADAAPDAAGWVDVPVTAAMPVDMLKIHGVMYELCSTRLAAGHYQQVRLVVQQNAGTAPPYHNFAMGTDGAIHPVDMPADMKIVHSFTVADGTTTDLTLDFMVQDSMHQRGNGDLFMTPVIGAASTLK